MKVKNKFLIAKIKRRIAQNRCFSEMEWKNEAAFGICNGKHHVIGDSYIPEKMCTHCRYYWRNKIYDESKI